MHWWIWVAYKINIITINEIREKIKQAKNESTTIHDFITNLLRTQPSCLIFCSHTQTCSPLLLSVKSKMSSYVSGKEGCERESVKDRLFLAEGSAPSGDLYYYLAPPPPSGAPGDKTTATSRWIATADRHRSISYSS